MQKLLELGAGDIVVGIEVEVRNEAIILILEEVDSLLLECSFYLFPDLLSRNSLAIGEDFRISLRIFVELVEHLLRLEELILIL